MKLTVYSRAGCTLCDEMLQELASLPDSDQFAIEVLDVDADAAARSRYGHKIPVLLMSGEMVCHGRLDPEELRKSVALLR